MKKVSEREVNSAFRFNILEFNELNGKENIECLASHAGFSYGRFCHV